MKLVYLLLTPLIIGVFAAVFRSLWIEPSSDLPHIATLAIQFAAVTYAIAIVFGLPAGLLIQRAGWRAAWQVVLIGAALGGISGALLPVVLGAARARSFFSGLYPYPLEYAMFGALTAFAAWWVVLRKSNRR